MKLVLIILFFLLLGGFFIISENNLSMKDSISRQIFTQKYSAWIEDIVENTVSITGNIIKLDWLPEK